MGLNQTQASWTSGGITVVGKDSSGTITGFEVVE